MSAARFPAALDRNAMAGFFKSASFVYSQLGELNRSRGAWRGELNLDAKRPVPLIVSGGRAAPDAEALRIARLCHSSIGGA